jgi:two-component system, OmpR family, sensor histidine kinase KdpD
LIVTGDNEMAGYERPDPDELLRKMKQEDMEAVSSSGRGLLKIYLGYAAGVGKTYRMLQDAGQSRRNGLDIIAAVIETHKRKETEALLPGLEVLAKKRIEYRGLALEEMDLDGLLARKPAVALVDELAHSNVPGSRHAKRYQDVEELLNAGIDVYTTLNIQHVESVVDIVQQASGITVEETVPDRILELADGIELVDLTPEKLLERFKAGKVYIPAKAEQAMKKFFRMPNLLALRELSLNYTAKQVNENVRTYMEKHSIAGPLPVGSRLLVGITPSKSSERLLRFTHRLASDLDAEWHAVYVESMQSSKRDRRSMDQLNRNIRLAEELGALITTLSSNNIADEMLAFAKTKNVSLIIAGLSRRSRLEEIFKGSVINELSRKSGPINVLVVGEEKAGDEGEARGKEYRRIDLRRYIYSFAAIAATTALGWFLIRLRMDPLNAGMMLLLPAIGSGILWGNRAGLFASLVAVGAFDFFFVPPYYSLHVSDLKYIPSFLVFILVSVTISFMAKVVRWQIESARQREHFISTLYAFTREIMAAENAEEALRKAVKSIAGAFESDVVMLLPGGDKKLEVKIQSRDGIPLSDSEKAVAAWVRDNNMPAGRSTKTLSSVKWYFLPLKIKDKSIGVIGLYNAQDTLLTQEEDRLFESFAGVIAMALSKPL